MLLGERADDDAPDPAKPCPVPICSMRIRSQRPQVVASVPMRATTQHRPVRRLCATPVPSDRSRAGNQRLSACRYGEVPQQRARSARRGAKRKTLRVIKSKSEQGASGCLRSFYFDKLIIPNVIIYDGLAQRRDCLVHMEKNIILSAVSSSSFPKILIDSTKPATFNDWHQVHANGGKAIEHESQTNQSVVAYLRDTWIGVSDLPQWHGPGPQRGNRQSWRSQRWELFMMNTINLTTKMPDTPDQAGTGGLLQPS